MAGAGGDGSGGLSRGDSAGDQAGDGGGGGGGRGLGGDDGGDRGGRVAGGSGRGRGDSRGADGGGATGQTELARVVGRLALLADLKSVVRAVGEALVDGPGELATGSSGGQGTHGVEVGGETLAEDEGGRGVVRRGVGDLVGLAGLNTTSRVLVDLDGESSCDESSAGSDHLEETHFDVWWWIVD